MQSEALGYLARFLQSSSDQFGKLIADSTKNKLDLASHYQYNPERWRLFVDGSRVFPEYNSVSQYNHAPDLHQLQPAAGETVVLETAERPRYVVQYELATTWAVSLNQALASGDTVKIGLFDGTDGWFLEKTGAHSDKEATLVTLRNGSRVATVDVTLEVSLTTFTRFLLLTNWYNVGAQQFQQTWTENGVQENVVFGRMSRDDGRGPQVGNLPIRFEVTASASTSGLVLNAGSVASVTLGDTEGLTRTKVSKHTHTFSTTGSYAPILALRTDPDRAIVNTQLVDAFVGKIGSGDVNLLVTAHHPSNVQDSNGNPLTDSNFSTPPEHHERNSVVEVSTDVDQAADKDGNIQASTASPGGFQVGYGSLYSSGTGARQSERVISRQQKRPIFGRDVIVVWGKSSGQTSITYELATEQDF